MRAAIAIALVAWLAPAARAESEVTASWQGLRSLGMSTEERQGADDVIAASLTGDWFGSVERNDAVAARCGAKVECHCAAARGRHLRYAAFGTVGRLGDRWTVELTVIETHACTVVAGSLASEQLASSESLRRLREIATRLGRPPEATGATAVKSARSLDHTPAIVTTITSAELAATQMTSLEDVFASQAGFDVIDTNWGGLLVHQGMRNTMLLVIDGIPQINGMINLRSFQRDAHARLRNIERIEMVRGPGSVIWGPNAFLGVVNLVRRDVTSREGLVDAGIELGSSDSQELWVNGAQSRGSYAAIVGVGVGRRRGLPSMVHDSPYAVRGVPAGETAPWGNTGMTQPEADQWLDVSLKLRAGSWLTMSFDNITAETAWEISPFGALLDPGEGGSWKKTWRTYGAMATREVGAVTLTAQASRLEGYSLESVAIQPKMTNASETDPAAYQHGLRSLQGNYTDPRLTHQAEARAAIVSGPGEGGWTNQLVVGVAALHLRTPASYSALVGLDEEPTMPKLDFGAKNMSTLSAFGVDEWSPVPWLVLAGGARFRIAAPIEGGAGWTPGVDLQGGAVIAGDGFGAKVIYAEGYRSPEANSLFSTSGTRGNPALEPERSREVAAELHLELAPSLTTRIGGNVTQLSNQVLHRSTPDDPVFVNEAVNAGKTHLASGFVELRHTSELVDADLRYGVTSIQESDPIGLGLPYAPHTIAGRVVVRPARDLAVFARSNAVSPRTVTAVTPLGTEPRTLPWGVRLTLGGVLSNVLPGFDLELRVDNPFGFRRSVPYSLSGNPTFVEERSGTEAFATLRWSK